MFSSKRYFELLSTTLLLVGLPQFIAPVLKWHAMSGAAYAQSNRSVRLSRSVIYNNANSPDAFQDDHISYRLTLENHEGKALTGMPISVDGQQVQRVMIASAVPAGTYLIGTPYAPPGWQTLYSTDDRQQTGRSNNSPQVSWTSIRPDGRSVRRIAFVKANALDAYEIADGMIFNLSLADISAYAPGVRNTVEFYAASESVPVRMAADENFYTDIDGVEVARANSGKPTAEFPTVAAIEPEPVAPVDPPMPMPIDLGEAPVEPVASEPIASEPIASEPVEPEPVAQVSEPGGMCTLMPVSSQYSVGIQSGLGGTPASPQVGGFVPISQVPGQNLTYVNAMGRMDDYSDPGANVVVGHRFYNEAGDRIHGGYIAYDLGNTGQRTFNQVGVGAETLGEVWDGRVNAYIPLEGRQEIDSSDAAELTYQNPLTTIEAEVGAKLHSFNNGGEVRAYAGPYYYTETGTVGGRVGLSAEPISGITIGASLQADDVFDTQVGFSLNYQFGDRTTNRTIIEGRDVVAIDSAGNPCNRLNRIDTPIRRTAPVRVETQTEAIPPMLSVSDRTLKENIEYLGETEQGFKLYAFNYIKHRALPTGRFVGVMAQDLLQDHPEAVVIAENSKYAVDYAALGLRMATYQQWAEGGLTAVVTD